MPDPRKGLPAIGAGTTTPTTTPASPNPTLAPTLAPTLTLTLALAHLVEQAGYRLDAVVQIAPMHPTITVFGSGAARRPPPDANAQETHTLDPWRKGTL